MPPEPPALPEPAEPSAPPDPPEATAPPLPVDSVEPAQPAASKSTTAHESELALAALRMPPSLRASRALVHRPPEGVAGHARAVA